MADQDTLQRLAAIVDRLTSLGQMTKGTPLRADDWNAVIGSVLDLARLSVAREQATQDALTAGFAAKDHKHVSQVDVSWLDPAAQALIEQRGGAPEQVSQLNQLTSDVAGLRKELAALQQQMRGLVLRVDGLADGANAGSDRLGRVETRLEAVRDVNDGITRIDGRFAALGDQLTQAITLKNQLVDATGKPVDLPGVVQRLGDLEGFRDNLKAPDGSLVRYRDFDSRVSLLEDRAVTRDNLDASITDRLAAGGVVDALAGGLLAKVQAQSDASLADVNGKLGAVQTDLAAVKTSVAAHTTALGALTTRVTTTEAQLPRIGALEGKVTDLGGRVNDLGTTVLQHTGALSALSGVTLTLGTLDTRLKAVEPLGDRVTSLASAVTAAQGQLATVAGLDARLKTVEGTTSQLTSTTQRVGVLETQLAAAQGQLATVAGLDARLKTVEGTTSQLASTTQRVSTLETQLAATRSDTAALKTSVDGVTSRVGKLETTKIVAPPLVKIAGASDT